MRLEQLAEQTVTANERIRQSEETRRDCEQKVSSLRSQSRELSARKETPCPGSRPSGRTAPGSGQ